MKWLRERKKRQQEQLELLRRIAKSLNEIEQSIDRNSRYGNAIKVVRASRY
jgi:hypothetical protein